MGVWDWQRDETGLLFTKWERLPRRVQLKSDMIRKNEFPARFPLKHMTKDLKFVVDTAYDVGAAVPVCLELLQLFRTGVGRGFGDEDFAGVMKVLQSMSDEGKS